MEKLDRRKVIALILSWIIFLSVISIGFYVMHKDNKELEANPVYGYAVIVDTYIGAKAKSYVKYEFRVGHRFFTGVQKYMPHKEYFNVGDTCEVVYAKTNPKINRLLEDENGLIKKKR